jgi:hypothetical protein
MLNYKACVSCVKENFGDKMSDSILTEWKNRWKFGMCNCPYHHSFPYLSFSIKVEAKDPPENCPYVLEQMVSQ